MKYIKKHTLHTLTVNSFITSVLKNESILTLKGGTAQLLLDTSDNTDPRGTKILPAAEDVEEN